MTSSVLFGLLTGLVLAAPVPPPDSDQKKIQGEWKVTSAVINGKKEPDKEAAKMGLFVEGDKMTARKGNDIVDQLSFRLDDRAKLKTLTMKMLSGADEGKTVEGIYKLEGDLLTICVAEPGRKRPEEFTTERGGGHILLVFKRAKR